MNVTGTLRYLDSFMPDSGVPWQDLPSDAEALSIDDGVVVLDYATIVGLNTPSPLSVPYALDRMRPYLEDAASAARAACRLRRCR